MEDTQVQDRLQRAYTERMIAVKLLCLYCGYPYGIGKDTNEAWDDEWRNVVYIDLPCGQVSWHIAPADLPLFKDFPKYDGVWDGTFKNRDVEFALGL